MAATSEKVLHFGGCHCGSVKFQVFAPRDIEAICCNCSICHMKQNHHFIVPERDFTLLQGAQDLTTYTFNTHAAKHTFCKTCGVQSFYSPRSNPDGKGITIYCLDQANVRSIKMIEFDGKNWEKMMENDTYIRGKSK